MTGSTTLLGRADDQWIRLGSTRHHHHCSLNALGIEVFLASWPVVQTLDLHLLSCGDSVTEHMTESDTYIIRGPARSQAQKAFAAVSSMGPSYKFSTRYFCAVLGEGRRMTIIANSVSAVMTFFSASEAVVMSTLSLVLHRCRCSQFAPVDG